MSDAERWTIGRLLQWTTEYLKKSGSASPRLDAEVLLSDARGCQRIQLYTAFDEEPGEAERTRFRDLVKRRAAGEPVAYLVGRREFYSLSFRVTPDVLIPRPETEFVVLGVLDALQQRTVREEPARVADVGTGSGAIAISVAKHTEDARITASDISSTALALARENAAQLAVAPRIEFLVSDLFESYPAEQRFDVIASNPPYLGESEVAGLSRDVRDFEPRGALVAGSEGSEVIQRLIAAAPQRLVPGGALIVEMSPMLEPKIRELFSRDAHWAQVTVSKDLAGLARVVRADYRP
ncbi:MAG: peptide chain release factor N(5)-glutamine methyltransferase [Pirellulaceae bacterium]